MEPLFQLTKLDFIWLAPFFYLSFVTLTQMLEAFSKVFVRKINSDRLLLLDCIREGRHTDAKGIILSTKDHIIDGFGDNLIEYLDGVISETSNIEDNLKSSLHKLLRLKLPHELSLNSFCGDILYVGFGGTVLSMLYLFSRFKVEITEFSQIFVYMGMAMKSSAFGVAASFLVSRGIVVLAQRLEIRKEAARDFHNELLGAIISIRGKGGFENE